ncbi:MAG TPA: UDP-N-acetylmuramoyl-L-alanyl-D-glutamate--2,6-diaminopimelate ligase [Longilinea sp.]|nr:UDP-N-acetylmuramoyl-L-alanyl-D-glutamate--2,6-diaminopimelate ligase [Longilinea sp.]
MNTLTQLFAQIPLAFTTDRALPDTPISAVVFDSRQVQPGTIFVALAGVSQDGHQYIPAAVQKGAAAVVGSKDITGLPVPYIRVEDTRPALAYISAAFNGWPARKLTVLGVTGTDGKTTTSNLLYRILIEAGLKAGMISTVNAVIGDTEIDTGFHVTTPDAPDVQRYLAQMVAAGLSHVVLESTSHGLAQHRVTGCEYDIGVVTNITHEHLDYHGSYENYLASKGRLFTMLAETGPKPGGNIRLAVLNKDDRSYPYLDKLTTVKKITYSLQASADIWAEDMGEDERGVYFTAVTPAWRQPVHANLAGRYNIYNSLAAISAAVFGLGIAPDVAARGIAALAEVPGRMERIDLGQDFTAIVDFAHTPFALESALRSARQFTRGRLIAVFGSAGLRDRAKRRMMAEVSAELADLTILTAEDPRTESLDGILAEMAKAAEGKGGVEGKTFWRVPDRGEAIRLAVKMAQPGDMVLACGKGHEQSMCFNTTEYLWDDRTAMRAAVAERLGIEGYKMPYLPSSDKELDSWLKEK